VEHVLADDEVVEGGDGAGEDVDVADGLDGVGDAGGEVEDAADGDAQHVDFGVEGDLLDFVDVTVFGGGEGFGVEAVGEGVFVAGLAPTVSGQAATLAAAAAGLFRGRAERR